MASKEWLGRTLVDALGTAAGFAAAILVLGAVREALTIGFPLAALPPGAFLVAGLLLAAVNIAESRRRREENPGVG